MRVKELMTRGVEVIEPDSTLQEAAEKMKEFDVGVLPVCERYQLVGMITDRDITVRSAAVGLDPAKDRVRFVMTRDVISCFEDQEVTDADRLMKDYDVRRLLVLNQDRRLVGILSQNDLAAKASNEGGGRLRLPSVDWASFPWPSVP